MWMFIENGELTQPGIIQNLGCCLDQEGGRSKALLFLGNMNTYDRYEYI